MIIPVISDPIEKIRFEHAVQIVLEHEGHLSDDKNDPGGITNWGISLRYLKDIHLDIDRDGDIDADDIRKLTLSEAKCIYRKYWWKKFHYNDIKDIDVATKVFDLSVNMGSSESHKILQRSINELSNQKIIIDGQIGPQTISAANKMNGSKLLVSLRSQARQFYINLVDKNSKLRVFLNGWLNRAGY